jgi:hypothetical protein
MRKGLSVLEWGMVIVGVTFETACFIAVLGGIVFCGWLDICK